MQSSRPWRRVAAAAALAIGTAFLTFTSALSAQSLAPGARATFERNGPGATPRQRFSNLEANKNREIEVEPDLIRRLSGGDRADFAVELSARPDLSRARDLDWKTRGRFVHDALVRTARASQRAVIDVLSARGAQYDAFWIKNVVLVRNGDAATLQSLMRLSGIERIRTPPEVFLIQPDREARTRGKVAGSNIEQVRANEVWAQGITGVGAVVGVIDSGVRYSHEALVTQYRGNLGGGTFDHDYNWFDPEGGTLFPQPASTAIDDQHGTHVAGTIVGDDFDPNPANRNQVGMAPGAKWIACQGFPATGSVDAALLGCGEFMLAPTDLQGNNPDPDLRPMAVNNSWGDCAQATDDFFSDVIDSWNAAGVIPVFSGGNASNCGYSEPPGPNTVGNPGRYTDVFTVGSTGNNDGLYAEHSNWGPTDDVARTLPGFPDNFGYDDMKPDVVAPGVEVRSTIGTTDTSYDSAGWTGTSMSSPHVTGLMALMFDAGSCLVGDFATVGTIIKSTARAVPYASNNPGGGEGPGNLPNYATGFGEIDAVEAVLAAEDACGPQGTIAGTVTSGATPVANATVEIFVDDAVRVWKTTTDAQGNYTRKVPATTAPATYTVRVSKYGFLTEEVAGLALAEDQVLDVDLQLDPAPTFTLSGTVTDAVTGWGLHARVEIDGYPSSPVYTDPVTGEYEVVLAQGYAFELSVSSLIPGYVAEARDIGTPNADRAEDFALAADDDCTAPGYAPAPGLEEQFEGAFPPAGWDVLNNNGGACVWSRNDQLGIAEDEERDNYAGGQGFAAAADSDLCGSGTEMDTTLVSPPINVASLSNPVLQLVYAYRHFGASNSGFYIDVSPDGTTWTNVLTRNTVSDNGTGPGAVASLPLTAVATAPAARVRFRYTGDYAYYAQVDQVRVRSATCAVPTGGLVVGRVIDDNTGAGLNGAQVEVAAGDDARTATSPDPAIGAGFYYAYAAAGARNVEASAGSNASGYGDASALANVVAGETTRVDLALPAGRLAFDPAAGVAATLAPNGVATRPLDVVNDGALPAQYVVQAGLARQDFEAGVPAEGWTVQNGSTDCEWLSNADYSRPNYAGGLGLSATADSDQCGFLTVMDTSLVSPRLDFSTTSTAALRFVTSFYTLGGSSLEVDVSLDDGATWDSAWSLTESTSEEGPGTPVEVDLSEYVGSSQTRIRFRYVAPFWDYWAQVDQVRLYVDAGYLPWLGVSPLGGTVAAGPAERSHNVVFDANGVQQPGPYVADLRLANDTPYVTDGAQATMTVTTPASYGTLSGTVTGLGYCDASPAPLANANVVIATQGGVVTTTTDANGNYAWAIDSARGPFTITASAAGHVQASSAQVPLSPGATADTDIALRAALPCFDATPVSITASLRPGDSVQRPITLSNDGAGVLAEWLVEAGGDPSVDVDVPVSQSSVATIEELVGVACPSGENEFLRIYDLDEEGLLSGAELRQVRFGVEVAEAGSGTTQPAEVRVYSVVGPADTGTYTQLGSEAITIANAELATITTNFDPPVAIPAGSRIAISVVIPNRATHDYFPGANEEPEEAPSYIRAPSCGATVPTTYAALGFPEVHLVIDATLNGSAPCSVAATPVDWMSFAPSTGALAADASGVSQATLDADGLTLGAQLGSVCVSASDPGNGAIVIPVELTVEAAPDAVFASGFED